ncbi:unnamed protein product [Xylocopa violacea]|uniref:Uncharacterized protein n=1 Tax=Xylocopa violacea TaxID=135666 RepID=A0ABP1NQR5_XYLVO
MPLHYVKNPMYALCLLAAVCVRQHVQSTRSDQPLTKGVTFQTPTSVLTKPNETTLKTVINANKNTNPANPIKLKDADSLIMCVQNFAKRAGQIVDDIRLTVPVQKSAQYDDPFASTNILDSLLYLTSSVGVKWLA